MTTPDPIRAALRRLVEELNEYDPKWDAFPEGALDAARAALEAAPPTPAAGEVGELVAWLQETASMIQPSHLAEHQRYTRAAALLEQFGSTPPAPQPVAVSDAAVFALTESLGMIAMKFAAESMKKSRHDEACRRMRSDARQVILEWLNALPIATTTPAGQEGADG